MENEIDILEGLKAVGYDGKFLQNSSGDTLQDALVGGQKSDSFKELITWIAWEIHILRKTEEKIAKETDFNEFMLELSGLLKELGCPYTQFIAGPITSRLQTKESKILLLDYLITELMALKMCLKIKPLDNTYIIPMFESSTASALQSITKELNLGKPPDNISSKQLFEKLANRLDDTIKKTNPKKLSQPLFKTSQALTSLHWEKLSKLQKELDDEYNLRRQMLLTRLDVTIQSFQWSEKMKGREDDIVNRYQTKRKELDELQYGDIQTDIAALLAARLDLAIIEKTSSSNVRKNTGTKIQKHVIGKVPDRGGRAYEHAPPPPEMPSWQQNRASGPTGGGRGGGGGPHRGGNRGGGGGGGGRGGNWSQQSSGQGGGGYNQRPQFDNRQQNDQRQQQPQFDNRQQYDQKPQYDNSNRVQGGWTRGNDKPSYNQRGGGGDNKSGYYGGNNSENSYRGGSGGGGGGGVHHQSNNNYGGGGQYQNQNYERGGGNSSYRGRSNYSRGGGGGGSGGGRR